MTRLDCTVDSCLFNCERCCCKDNIQVEGDKARHSRDTCCVSFRERRGDMTLSGANVPTKNTDVTCLAEECTFNKNCHCQARHIGIAGGSAITCRDTECASFRCKCE